MEHGMKVQIECDSGAEELQVLIRCRELDDQVKEIQQALSIIGKYRQQFVFYKGDTEFYMPLNEVLFMETDGNAIQVHTRDDIYQTRYKLYELEELLPGQFMRVSKSAILNTSHVYSITKTCHHRVLYSSGIRISRYMYQECIISH